MKEIQATIYEAFDGEKFFTEYDCKRHETEQQLIKKGFNIKGRFDEIIKDVKHYCGQMLDEEYSNDAGMNVCKSAECPFFNDCVERQNCLFKCIPYYDF